MLKLANNEQTGIVLTDTVLMCPGTSGKKILGFTISVQARTHVMASNLFEVGTSKDTPTNTPYAILTGTWTYQFKRPLTLSDNAFIKVQYPINVNNITHFSVEVE